MKYSVSNHLLGLALLVAASPGCLPFVVPPARLSMGPGLRSHAVSGTPEEPLRTGVATFRAGLHPLGVLRDGYRKPYDLGVGYSVEGSSDVDVPTVHGPYLELGAYPLIHELNEKLALRAGVQASLDALFQTNQDDARVGLSVGPLVELTGDASGPFAGTGDDGGVILGASHGYFGVGVFANASLRDLGQGLTTTYSGGLSLRIPLAAGIVCCAIPSLGGGESSGSGSESGGSGGGSGQRRLRRTPADPKPGK